MLEAAGRLLDRHRDGVWLAELAPLGDPSQIPSEVARALGAPEIAGVPAIATVTAFLADKDLLLLLDNAEHLVDGVARFAERLLASAPGLRIMTTSREALAVSGEAVLHLQSLSCPTAGAARRRGMADEPVDLEQAASTEAVRLFAERAAAVDPAFTLDQSNVASVGEICRRLDGIPLAIELAAARVSAMSPDEIALRLGDRFRLLTGGRRTAVPRQQTLHALIDWSWDLLADEDRRLLRRLSIFTGGWTVPMAAQIVGDGHDGAEPMDPVDLVDGLTRLVDRSLLIVDRGPTTRYRMLETIRQYAREKLIGAGEAATLADRHLAVYRGARRGRRGAGSGPGHGRLAGSPGRRGRQPRRRPGVGPRGGALDSGPDGDGAPRLLGGSRHVAGQRRPNLAAIEIAKVRVVGRTGRRSGRPGARGPAPGRGRPPVGDVRVGPPWRSHGPRSHLPSARRAATRRAPVGPRRGCAIATVFSGRAGPGGTDARPIFAGGRRPGRAERRVVDPRACRRLLRCQPRRLQSRGGHGPAPARRGGGPPIGEPVRDRRGVHRPGPGARGAWGGPMRRWRPSTSPSSVSWSSATTVSSLAARSDLAHALRRGGRTDAAPPRSRSHRADSATSGAGEPSPNPAGDIGYLDIERGVPIVIRLSRWRMQSARSPGPAWP